MIYAYILLMSPRPVVQLTIAMSMPSINKQQLGDIGEPSFAAFNFEACDARVHSLDCDMMCLVGRI
jgi:hypothetical protein